MYSNNVITSWVSEILIKMYFVTIAIVHNTLNRNSKI